MTAKEIANELNDMLAGDLDEYGEEGMETTEDAVHEACAAVLAWEKIGRELDLEKEFLFAVCDPECEQCIKSQFELFRSIIKRAFDGSGIDLSKEPDTEQKKKALEEEQQRQAQLEFCRSFREWAPVTIEADEVSE